MWSDIYIFLDRLRDYITFTHLINSYNIAVLQRSTVNQNITLFSSVCVLTIKPVDTHHKVYAVIKLLVVFLGGEVGQIWCQERKVAVQAGLKAQLFEQLLFGFVETGEKGYNIYKKTRY